jgi:hypothetical protein
MKDFKPITTVIPPLGLSVFDQCPRGQEDWLVALLEARKQQVLDACIEVCREMDRQGFGATSCADQLQSWKG